ncbi:MAG: nuclear transport factor 2 family protein [Acidimicrobiales bacterium]
MNPAATPREAIAEVLARYCRGIDRRDRDLVASCFHGDATDDHGRGPVPLDEFLDWCFGLLAGYDHTFHFLGQSLFEFAVDDRCHVETYGIAQHRTTGGATHRNLVTGFRYLDDFRRGGDGEWRIERRRAVTDWSRTQPEDGWWDVPPGMVHGRPGPDDPSHLR